LSFGGEKTLHLPKKGGAEKGAVGRGIPYPIDRREIIAGKVSDSRKKKGLKIRILGKKAHLIRNAKKKTDQYRKTFLLQTGSVHLVRVRRTKRCSPKGKEGVLWTRGEARQYSSLKKGRETNLLQERRARGNL